MEAYIKEKTRMYSEWTMLSPSAAGPCVLFVNGTRTGEYESVRQWLSDSRFQTYEASDVFDAMEELYDFMGSEMPNVIVVQGADGADAVSGFMDGRVVYYSPENSKPGCINNLRQLSDQLDTFFPRSAPRNRVSA